MTKRGFPVIAISADRLEGLEGSLKSQDLGYTLYSDSTLTAARAFGIVFQLGDDEVRASEAARILRENPLDSWHIS